MNNLGCSNITDFSVLLIAKNFQQVSGVSNPYKSYRNWSQHVPLKSISNKSQRKHGIILTTLIENFQEVVKLIPTSPKSKKLQLVPYISNPNKSQIFFPNKSHLRIPSESHRKDSHQGPSSIKINLLKSHENIHSNFHKKVSQQVLNKAI